MPKVVRSLSAKPRLVLAGHPALERLVGELLRAEQVRSEMQQGGLAWSHRVMQGRMELSTAFADVTPVSFPAPQPAALQLLMSHMSSEQLEVLMLSIARGPQPGQGLLEERQQGGSLPQAASPTLVAAAVRKMYGEPGGCNHKHLRYLPPAAVLSHHNEVACFMMRPASTLVCTTASAVVVHG